MKKALFLTIIYCIFCTVSFAAETEYKLLAPLPGVETTEGKTTASTYIEGFFQLMIMIAGVLAVVMLIYGGVKYASTDAFTGKSEGKAIIENAIWGLMLAIGSYLILYTISPDLLKFNLSLNTVAIQPNAPPPTGSGTPGPGGGEPGAGLSQIEAMRQLDAAGIGIAPRTLRLAGLQQATINELIRLKGECNCAVIVTSATGGSHRSGTYSHANGYKIDLRNTGEGEALTNFITTRYTRLPDRVNPPAQMYRSPGGAVYAKESNHWDVVAR